MTSSADNHQGPRIELPSAIPFDRLGRRRVRGSFVKVYLVRHAQADSDVPEGLDDGARPLTGKGRHAAEKHFRSLTKRMHGLDIVLMSPLVRAVQTAQILTLVQDL